MNWNILNSPLGISGSMGVPEKKEMPIPLAVPIAMAAASALSSIWGGSQSAKAAEKARKQQEAEKARLEAERTRAKNERWGDTASGQNTLRIIQQAADREVKRIQGGAAVGGLTDAAVAQEKELQNQKQAEVIAQANANFEDKKDAVDASYRGEIARVNAGIQQSEAAKAEAIAQAAGGVSSALMQGAISTFGGTKLGQSWFGTGGSPGGSGVDPQYRNYSRWLQQNQGVINNPSYYRYMLGYGGA